MRAASSIGLGAAPTQAHRSPRSSAHGAAQRETTARLRRDQDSTEGLARAARSLAFAAMVSAARDEVRRRYSSKEGFMAWLAGRVARLSVAVLCGSVVYLSAFSAHAQVNTGRCLPAPAWVNGPVGDTTNPQPTLSWAPVPGATGYTLYVRDAVTEEWFLR